MKVKELIEKLQDEDQDLEVRLLTDHGQVLMTCNGAGEGWIREDEYMADEVSIEELTPEDIKVFVLEAY